MSIRKLREAVEAGKLTNPGNEHWLAEMPRDTWEPIVKANSGSLDAAKRLHDALLPGWAWEICSDDAPDAAIVWNHAKLGRQFSGKRGDDGNVARAWLLAVLKALENQHEK